MDLYDVTIIGGGPTGLYTAFYSGMRALKTKLIEARADLGGVVTYFYPEKTIYDVGGIPQISGGHLIADLKQQADTFHPQIIRGQTIAAMEQLPNGHFRLTSTSGQRHETRKIILAVGNGTFDFNRLSIAEAALYEGKSLFYAIHSLKSMAGKRLVISGGGNAALDWAIECVSLCRKVTLIYRREQFKNVMEHQIARLKKHHVDVRMSSEITALSGENGYLRTVSVRNKQSGHFQTIEADVLMVSHGFKFGLGALEHWGMTLKQGIVVSPKMESTVPGIYGVGNAASYPEKLYLIASGFVEGAIAVNSIKKALHPQASSQAMVSTHHPFFDERARS
ncbi:MAG: NAD(P)/FAD-dependent oxidoreductase [Sporolactobacillus sp.]